MKYFSNSYDALDRFLGLNLDAGDLTFMNMAGRSLIVFIFGVILVRFADRRFLGRHAGYDVLLSIVLGSVLSRAINGQARFFPTLGASVLLVLFHHALGAAAFRFHFFSKLVKGQAYILVKNGKVKTADMAHTKVSQDDLEENLRINGNVGSVEEVAEARLERNGSISVVKKSSSE